jgi:hypothetical protein
MKYNQPYGVSDPNAAYINGNPSTGTMGSIPPAASIEYPQREIVAMIADAGINPDNADLTQLAKAVQSCYINFVPDTGTVNALNVTMTPAPAYRDGLVIRTKVSVNNTGQASINVNAQGAKLIRRKGDTDLLANDLTGGSIATLTYNSSLNAGAGAFELMGVGTGGTTTTPGGGGQITANMNLYVNNAIGSDANDGTANDAAHALATIQRAVNLAFSYLPSQFMIYIWVKGPGPYAGCNTPPYAGNSLTITGDGATVTQVHAGSGFGFLAQGPNTMTVSGFNVSNTSGPAGPACFAAVSGATMTTHDTASGNTGGSVFGASSGGSVNTGNHTFYGPGGYAGWWASALGTINLQQGSVFSFPSLQVGFTLATVVASGCGVVSCSATNPVSFPGAGGNAGNAVNNPKYLASFNGIVNMNQQGVNFLPGNQAGSLAYGGQYA